MLFAVVLWLSACGLTASFPMCTDGQPPLMEANDAFPCSRGCPKGFTCEYQDAQNSNVNAVCCANMTALIALYGDDTENHIDPIWDFSGTASNIFEDPSSSQVDLMAVGKAMEALVTPDTSSSEMSRVEPSNVSLETGDGQVTTAASTSKVPADSISSYPTTDDMGRTVIKAITFKPDLPTEESTTSNPAAALDSSTAAEVIHLQQSAESTTIADIINDLTVDRREVDDAIPVTHSAPEPTITVTVDTASPANHSPKYSCLRDRFRLFCNESTRTQPTIRWYFNLETASCEFYPWGYCPGDRIIKSSTLRTKAECEALCTPQSLDQSTTFKMPSVEPNPISTDLSSPDESDSLLSLNSPEPVEVTSTTTVHPPAFNPPKEFRHNQVVEDSEVPLTIEDIPIETPEDDLITEATESTNLREEGTSNRDIEDKLSESSNSLNDEMEGSGFGDITDNSLMKRQPESFATFEEPAASPMIESSDGIRERLQKLSDKKVYCQSTPYRYVCNSGMPSQFVYRWQVNGGLCESFPYGYCYGEFNHGHPRTFKECMRYCGSEMTQLRLL